MLNINQYKDLCLASDKILSIASDNDEIVSIPLLHVLREHSECLRSYEFLNNGKGKARSNFKNLKSKFFALMNSTLFDSSLNLEVSNIHNDLNNLIVVSHITNINQCNKIEDAYFGNLKYDLLKYSDIKPIIVLINQTSFTSKKLSKKLANNGIEKIILPKSSGLINELKIFLRLSSSVKKFTNDLDPSNQIEESLGKAISQPGTYLSGMSALRIGFFLEKIIKYTNSKYLITTYEGHARERIIFSSARKVNQNILCFAFQHSILNKYQHALKRKIHEKYNPDHIFCCGLITYRILSNLESLNGISTSILGSPNGLPLQKLNKPVEDRESTIIFLPEGLESEYRIFYNFILECSSIFPNFKFIWRSHPLLDIKSLSQFKLKNLPANVTISRNEFDLDVHRSHIAIYRGTAAIIRAVKGGLLPIYLELDEEIGIDIMHSLNLEKVNSASGLKRLLQKNLFSHKETSSKFCHDYYRPMNYKSLVKVVKSYAH